MSLFSTLASRKFSDLIYSLASKYPNWDPPLCAVEVGDYGTIDRETGQFDVEGNILKDPDGEFTDIRSRLNDVSTEKKVHPEDVYKVSSSNCRDISLSAGVDLDAVFASAVFKGAWKFEAGASALLIAHRPSQVALPRGLSADKIGKHPKLKGKVLVNSVMTCSSYALYHSPHGNTGISLALSTQLPIGTIPVSAGPSVEAKWWSSYDGGLYRAAASQDGDFTVLFNLKRCKRTWFRGAINEDVDEMEDFEPPWGELDEDGAEIGTASGSLGVYSTQPDWNKKFDWEAKTG